MSQYCKFEMKRTICPGIRGCKVLCENFTLLLVASNNGSIGASGQEARGVGGVGVNCADDLVGIGFLGAGVQRNEGQAVRSAVCPGSLYFMRD